MSLSRRYFMQSAAAAAMLFAAPKLRAQEKAELKFGAEKPFSFDALIKRAARMADEIYVAPAHPAPEIVNKIDYDAHSKLRFKRELALYADMPGAYPVTFFHLGMYFPKKVTINILGGETARELIYDDSYFEMPTDSPAHKLGRDSGFAGFRLQEDHFSPEGHLLDWCAFLGASYFRAVDENGQYGMSARGVAVNTAVPNKPEEFPDFREFWIEETEGEKAAAIYALLDSPSISGAYKFIVTREQGTFMDVEAHLFVRKDIEQLGIAPLTSMYWFSETRRPEMVDWRPEVHDSDGLEMWTGAGERIWRPLNNPPRVVTSSFKDKDPKGFGMMQRDRNFDHYLDGVRYESRPSLWIEPLQGWNEGEVQLVEIPTNTEIHDNIVAMWVPAGKIKAGRTFDFRYKMHWKSAEPYPATTARVVATRLGQGGLPGVAFPNKNRKFLIEFEGDLLATLPRAAKPEIVATASRGKIVATDIEPVRLDPKLKWDEPSKHWRAQFDLAAEGIEPVELRCYLRLGDKVLSETWLYQYHPSKAPNGA
ncbi:MAG: glucan biosynthesis protein D [Pseudomonadota bacterium]